MLNYRSYLYYSLTVAVVICCVAFLEEACMKTKFEAMTSELHKHVDEAITKALNKYDADKTGQVDFASEVLGGEIVSIRDTLRYAEDSRVCWEPSKILRANTQPGNCWPFAGATGTVVIKLICPVVITGLTYEHVSKSLVMNEDISSAPAEFSLTALSNPDDSPGLNLGKFVFDKDGPPIQYFPVDRTCNRPFKFVEFTVHSNNGNKNFTCLYRVRIHGNVQN